MECCFGLFLGGFIVDVVKDDQLGKFKGMFDFEGSGCGHLWCQADLTVKALVRACKHQ